MNQRRLVALLPMKAHSERVPGKNFRLLAGRPLFRWVLDTLLSLTSVEQVVINTDARAILATFGVSDTDKILIRDRAPEICGDHVSMNRIIEDDMHNIDAETYLMTHVTNPLISAATLSKAIDLYHRKVVEGVADSLFSVTRVQSRFYLQNGSTVNHNPRKLLRTQDLEPWFEENSNFYLFSRKSFCVMSARIGAHPILFETPKLESIDIDDQDDWEIAESLALRRNGSLGNAADSLP